MKKVIIIFFFLLSLNSFSQTLEQIFKDIDFSNHRYSLYLIDVDLGENNILKRDSIGRLLEIDTKKHFYCDDTIILKQIQKEWIGETEGQMFDCWYDYFGYLTLDDSIVLNMRINLDCKEFLVNGKPYRIHPEMITKFFPKFKTLTRRNFKCDNLQECRDYWASIQKDSLFVLKDISVPFWTKFNGYLSFIYTDTLQLRRYQVEELIRKEISFKHPLERFKIQSVDYFNDKENEIYNIKLLCNKSLYDHFTSFDDHKWVNLGSCKFSVFWKDQ